jgi:hypothetical protein
VNSLYNDLFLGGDSQDPETSDTVIAQEDGYVVKIALPEADEVNT